VQRNKLSAINFPFHLTPDLFSSFAALPYLFRLLAGILKYI